MEELNNKELMEKWEYLTIEKKTKYITSFRYIKDKITSEDLKELEYFLQYHGLKYCLKHVNYETRVENIKELRIAILDKIK